MKYRTVIALAMSASVLAGSLASVNAAEETVKPFKEETVYVITGTDGSADETIVTNWLKNKGGEAELNDVSNLNDIENVKGDETYTTGEENSLVWAAEGNDIYYRGTSDQELPVTLNVTYTLDGEEITAEELQGKSGQVTITFDYSANLKETKEIRGEETELTVPFAALTGVLLDTDCFTNVEVKHGTLINDGSHLIVAGFAFPGLADDLDLDSEEKDLEIPSSVVITADTTDFNMLLGASVVTNNLFEKTELPDVEQILNAEDPTEELKNSLGDFVDESSTLYEDLFKVLEKSGELGEGVTRLTDGVTALNDGAKALDEGTGKLVDGTKTLSEGLDTLAENNDALNGGAEQVFTTLLATAQNGLSEAGLDVPELTIENYEEVLDGIIDSLDETNVYNMAREQVAAAVEEQRDYIVEQVTAAVNAEVETKVNEGVREKVQGQVEEAVREEVTAKVTEGIRPEVEASVKETAGEVDEETLAGLVDEQMAGDEITSKIREETDRQMASDEVAALITEQTDAKMQDKMVQAMAKVTLAQKLESDEVKAIIEENVEEQVQKAIDEHMGDEEVVEKLQQASDGAQSVISLKGSLDSYNAFYIGLKTYTTGVGQAADGAKELKDGAEQLKEGTEALCDGTGQLYDGISELTEELEKVMGDDHSKFEEKLERFNAALNLAKEYSSFSGLSDDMEGSVRFIYRMEDAE